MPDTPERLVAKAARKLQPQPLDCQIGDWVVCTPDLRRLLDEDGMTEIYGNPGEYEFHFSLRRGVDADGNACDVLVRVL